MLVQSLLETARTNPRQMATHDPLRSFTYSELATLARVMRRLILKQTTRENVGIMLPATGVGLGTMLGGLWAGKTIVPLNFLLQPRELAAVIADSQIDLVITTEHFRALMEQVPARALYIEQIGLKRRFVREKLSRTPEPPDVHPTDLAAIVYTSGTTGEPKGVCLSYNNFVSNAQASIEHMRISPGHHFLGVLPPFHVFGLTVIHFIPVLLGSTVTYVPRFSPQAAYEAIAKHQLSILMAVPSMYAAIARLKDIDPAAFEKVHLAVSGGEPLPRTVYDHVLQRTGVRLMEGYGLTESSPVISCDLPWDHQVGTVGPLLPDVEIQIRDSSGEAVETGQRGELFVRGPNIMQGYYNKPEQTQAMISRDGWLSTGDICEMHADQHLRITGRAKDVIIVGGENVYPREVEAVLEAHPDIAEAAVVGKKSGTRGEVVVGFVVQLPGSSVSDKDLRSYCRDYLAGYKIPREIHLCEDFPRTPSGKILKRHLPGQPGNDEQDEVVAQA
jgi:long-chain acyl-CoA synthetase